MKNENQIKQIEKIRNSYVPKETKLTQFEEIKLLDKKAKNPAYIFAYIFGTIGVLIFGTGMCFGLEVFEGVLHSLWIGVGIGVFGAIMMALTFPIFKTIMKKRKARFGQLIIEKSNELL